MIEYKSRENLPAQKKPSQQRRTGRETYRLILDKTAEALNDTPFHELSIADVAKRMGMSPGTFYNYFSSLGEAVFELGTEFLYRLEEELHRAFSRASWISDQYADDGEHWSEGMRREILAVLNAFENVCVTGSSVLSAVASLAVGRGNSFSDILASARNILVRTLLEVVHYGSPSYPNYLLDAEASELLMFYLLPLGADQREVMNTIFCRVVDVAAEWRGKEESK